MRDRNDHFSRDAESRARTHLANERTFLPWLRTGVAMIALGLAAAQLLAREIIPGVPLARGIAVVFALGGIFFVTAGARRYFRSSRQIEAGEVKPAFQSILGAAALVVLLGLMAIVFILLLRL